MAETAIITRALTKRYGRVLAADQVDLEVPVGAVCGFIGPNGAGKTTVIKMLVGLTPPTSGQAEVLGQPAGPGMLGALSSLGYLSQDPRFYEWMTGREFLRYTGSLYPWAERPLTARVGDALELAGISDAADRRVASYSGGMRQRLGVAQALMGEPRALILDEPAASLDPLGRRDVIAMMGRLRNLGVTVFYSTHILEDVERVADHVCMMRAGRLVRQARLRDLLQQEGSAAVQVEVHGDAVELIRRAGTLDFVERVQQDPSPDGVARLWLSVNDPQRARSELPRLIVECGLELQLFRVGAASLERVFLEALAGEIDRQPVAAGAEADRWS